MHPRAVLARGRGDAGGDRRDVRLPRRSVRSDHRPRARAAGRRAAEGVSAAGGRWKRRNRGARAAGVMARRYVVIGASLAGATAAVALRDHGADGTVTLIGAEPDLPYERPPL